MPSVATGISAGASLLGGMGGKKGGSGGSGGTAYQLLPANIRSAVDNYFSRATDISNKPYTPYQGDRISPLSGDENTAIQYGRENFGQALPTIQGANQLNQQLIGMASQGPTAGALSQFMNPYQQLVIDQAKNRAIEDSQSTFGDIRTAAANTGAFGGSRQGLREAMASRDLNRQLSDIQNTGLQQGFTNAQDQFFKTLQTAGDLNQSAVQTARLGQEAVGTDISQMVNLGQLQRGISQAGLDQQYQDFANEQNYPIQSLNVLGSALSNTAPYFAPYQTQQGGGSSGSGIGNIVSGLAGPLSSMFGGGGGTGGFFNEGGLVKAYKTGGIISERPDAQLSPMEWIQSILNPNKKEGKDKASAETDTSGLAEKLIKLSTVQQDIDKSNTDVINQVGRNLSGVRFQDIASPYANQEAQATGYGSISRQNLFPRFQEGGLVKSMKEYFNEYLNPLYYPTGNEVKLDKTEKADEEKRKLAQGLPQEVGAVPVTDNRVLSNQELGAMIPKLPVDTTGGNPSMSLNEALVNQGVVPTEGQTQGNSDVQDLKTLMETFGLTQPKEEPPPPSSAGFTQMIMTLASSGLMSPTQINNMASYFGKKELEKKEQKESKDKALETKMKNVELGAKLQEVMNSREYARIQRMFALANAQGGGKGKGSSSALKDANSISSLMTKIAQTQKAIADASIVKGDTTELQQTLNQQKALLNQFLPQGQGVTGVPSLPQGTGGARYVFDKATGKTVLVK